MVINVSEYWIFFCIKLDLNIFRYNRNINRDYLAHFNHMLQIPVSYTSIYIVFRSFKLKVFNLFGVSGFLFFFFKDLLLFLIVCMYKCLSLYWILFLTILRTLGLFH